MKIVEFFMRRPTLFWSLTGGILIAGVLAFFAMPKLEDPAVPVKQAMVVVPYPGANAHQVELEVAQLMEDELRALPNVKKIKSECQNGSATITVEFEMSVLIDELEQHFDLLRRKVNDIASRLPAGCYSPIVLDDMMDVYGIFYALTAEGYDYPEMYKYAKYLRRELLNVKGVKRINISGNRDEAINIILPKEQLSRNGLIPTQLITSLQSVGKPVNAGEYQSGDNNIQIRIDSDIQNEEDIRNLLISTINGKQIRLGDVARIERAFSEPQRNGFFVDGKPALAICIAMEADAIVPDVGKAVDAKLAKVMQTVPAGMQVQKIFFQPDKVSEAISSFMWNLLESVAIVILVLIFTMGLRSGLIIGFGWYPPLPSPSPSCWHAGQPSSASPSGHLLWQWACWWTMPSSSWTASSWTKNVAWHPRHTCTVSGATRHSPCWEPPSLPPPPSSAFTSRQTPPENMPATCS